MMEVYQRYCCPDFSGVEGKSIGDIFAVYDEFATYHDWATSSNKKVVSRPTYRSLDKLMEKIEERYEGFHHPRTLSDNYKLITETILSCNYIIDLIERSYSFTGTPVNYVMIYKKVGSGWELLARKEVNAPV